LCFFNFCAVARNQSSMSTCLQQSVLATKPDTHSIKLAGAFSPSSEVAATVTPVNKLDCVDNWEGQLRKLHYSKLQHLCRCGPEPPFDELHLSRHEWSASICEGRGCKSAMIRKILDCHQSNIKHKRPGNEIACGPEAKAWPINIVNDLSWDVLDDEKPALQCARYRHVTAILLLRP
jgi:hypothetical protein